MSSFASLVLTAFTCLTYTYSVGSPSAGKSTEHHIYMGRVLDVPNVGKRTSSTSGNYLL